MKTETIESLRQERDEARDWVARLQKQTQTLTCVYCGEEYPPGTPAHGAPVLTAHILKCEKHPMRKVRSALAQLVGADGKQELETMELAIRQMPAPAADKAAAIDAIHALLETLPTP
jgi:hypothetical protein